MAIEEWYVDITSDVPNGDGSVNDPFTYEQFIEHTPTMSLGDDWVYNVKGYHQIDGGGIAHHNFITNFSDNIVTVVVRGWDIEDNGSPIIEFIGDVLSFGRPSIFDRVESGTSLTFENLIFINNHEYYDLEIRHATYKTVFFNGGTHSLDGYNYDTPNESYMFYGCTFQYFNINITNFENFISYDCVYIMDDNAFYQNNHIGGDFATKIIFGNNISNIPQSEFTNMITANDISQYHEPLSRTTIMNVPSSKDASWLLLGTYTNMHMMYYGRYDIPNSDNPTVQDHRINLGYDFGLFNTPRASFGAYTFTPPPPPPPSDTFPTSGHIGAFYFGGEYDNATVSSEVSLNIFPTENGASVSNIGKDLSTPLYLYIPDAEKNEFDGFAKGNQNFFIDFVGKERPDPTYPKFCDCIDCKEFSTSAEDIKDYETQITGGNPLVVDFSACAKSADDGAFAGYNPVVYKWYFDYGNYPNEYVSCAGPSATNTFCGGYLEEFDIRLCVDFEVNCSTVFPVITVLGDNPTTINVGDIYSDAGATATDACEGDITTKINEIDDVDTDIIGSYTWDYIVINNVGNRTTSKRVVNVV